MNTIQTRARYVEWLSAEDMHKNSQEWLSELRFIKDEHRFFEDLIKTYTLALIEKDNLDNLKELVDVINRSEKNNKSLIKAIKTHEADLKIMVDGINQPKEEEAYKETHRGLLSDMKEFHDEYKSLKTQIFNTIKSIKKTEKQQRLLDR